MHDDSTSEKLLEIWQAAQASDVARDWTHPLYRYPASMSPHIARSLLQVFTNPADTVLDPFCGGGTTAIEALAHGRRAICSDLNNLACLITRSKALPLRTAEISHLREWIGNIALPSLLSRKVEPMPLVTGDGRSYVPHTHALLLKVKELAEQIPRPKLRRVAQLMVLRTGQVCFDCTQRKLSPAVLVSAFRRNAYDIIERIRAYSERCAAVYVPSGKYRRLRVFCADAEKLPSILGRQMKSVSCVLTSPPYPGVHVLYHRWQFRGRKEISLPYTLANLKNGAAESHYTLGPRQERDNTTYFVRLHRIFAYLNENLRPGTIVAQVLAFSRPSNQLRRYLTEMQRAGLAEFKVLEKACPLVHRAVPNRRWYIRTGATISHKREYVLLHRCTGVPPRETRLRKGKE